MNDEQLVDWIVNPVAKFTSYDIDSILARIVELIKHNILYNNHVKFIHIYEYYDPQSHLSCVYSCSGQSLYINAIPEDKFLYTLLPILQNSFPGCTCDLESMPVVSICCYKLGTTEYISLQFKQ